MFVHSWAYKTLVQKIDVGLFSTLKFEFANKEYSPRSNVHHVHVADVSFMPN